MVDGDDRVDEFVENVVQLINAIEMMIVSGNYDSMPNRVSDLKLSVHSLYI